MVKNILSIDFDKFITKELMMLSEIRGHTGDYYGWIRRLADNRDYFNVGIKEDELIKVLRIILDQDNTGMVSVANSHARIIDSLNELYPNNTMFNIYNIDHHHDIYYGTKAKKDYWGCGNWVDHLKESGRLNSYMWINNEDSVELESNFILEHEMHSDIDSLSSIDFDHIFICKSSTWVPLHLHCDFYKFISVVGIEKGLKTYDAEHVNPIHNSDSYNKEFIQGILALYDKVRR